MVTLVPSTISAPVVTLAPLASSTMILASFALAFDLKASVTQPGVSLSSWWGCGSLPIR